MDGVKINLLLKSINDKLRQSGDQSFSEFNLTGPQMSYLKFIQQSGGIVAQQDLEKAFDVSHPTIVGIVGRLQKKGFVTVKIDEADKRKRIVFQTDKAEKVNERLEERWLNLTKLLVQGLSPEEINELYRMLCIINKNVNELLHTGKDDENE